MPTWQGSHASHRNLTATFTREYEDRLDWLENRCAPAGLSPTRVELLLQLAAWASGLILAVMKLTAVRSSIR
jgi:hypothetical protein